LHRNSLLATVACADLWARYALLVPEPSVFSFLSPQAREPVFRKLFQTCQIEHLLFFQSSRRILFFPQIADYVAICARQAEAHAKDSALKIVSAGDISFPDDSI
jgi:hypothetical protein